MAWGRSDRPRTVSVLAPHGVTMLGFEAKLACGEGQESYDGSGGNLESGIEVKHCATKVANQTIRDIVDGGF